MTRRHRRTALALLLVAALSGCADADEEYCGALAEEQETLTELASGAGRDDVLTPTLASFERLREAAPEELADEWDTVVFAYRALADAVEAAGVDPGDYRPDRPPPGLSKQEARRLAAVASKVASSRVRQAAGGIEQHAAEVCDVKFTG